jgi:predicted outer membrane repeat protein
MNAIARNRQVWFGVIIAAIMWCSHVRASVTNITSGGALYTTIQAAVNAAASGDTLLVSTGRYVENIFIRQKSLRLLGGYWADFITRTNAARLTYINGGGANTVLTAMSNCTVMLEYLMLTNGAALGGGGIILLEGVTLTARYCDVSHNVAWFGGGLTVGSNCTAVVIETPVYQNWALGGGGIYAFTRTASVIVQGADTDVRDNRATVGGGIYADGAQIQVLNNADVYGNVAIERGGGMYLGNGARGRISGNGTVIGTGDPNRATNVYGEGGGAYVADSSLVVENNAEFWANHATANGGAIYVTNGSVVVRNNAVIGYETGIISNYAGWLGGGICAQYARVAVSNGARVVQGYAQYGGGVFLWYASGMFERATLRSNTAIMTGGGLYAYNTGAVTLASCLVTANRALAQYGGGAMFNEVPGVVLSNTIVAGNSAYIGGGLVAMTCPRVTMRDGCLIAGNSALAVGGAYWIYSTALRATAVQVLSNTAVQLGGMACEACLDFDLADCDFVGNRSTNAYGGALVVGASTGRLRTLARPAAIRANEAQSGAGVTLMFNSRVEIEAPTHPLTIADHAVPGIGGGLWCMDASTVSVVGAVQFISNSATFGGAIMATNRSVITLVATNDVAPLVYGNAALGDGGGLYLMWSSVVVAVNCVMRENTAVGWGGGIYSERSRVRMVGAGPGAHGLPGMVLQGNQAANGGAVYSRVAALELFDALVVSNTATMNGGGVRVADGGAAALVNCVVVANSASSGGGIANGGAPLLQMRHCTISRNQSGGVVSGGGPMALTNCIVRGNTGVQVSLGHTVNYSDISGGYSGEGNIDADPLFAAPAELDYALAYGSPCVDTGIAAGVTWDCIGAPRPMGITYDMGAYEQDPAPVLFVAPTLLDFGDVVLGDTSNLLVGLKNIGNSMLTGTVNFVPAPIFTVTPGSYGVPPFATTNVIVSFTPPLEFHWTQTIMFAGNGGDVPVLLIGTGIPEPALWGALVLFTMYNVRCTIWRRSRQT